MGDVLKAGDYEIRLGDSFKDQRDASNTHIAIKYNWVPPKGFQNSTGTLKDSAGNVSLLFKGDDLRFEYDGHVVPQHDDTSQLILVYDPEQSAFVLERINASLEVNIKAGTNLSSSSIKRHTKFENAENGRGESVNAAEHDNPLDEDEDQVPDKTNPFDYRHFLSEARESADHNSLHGLGGRTPLPGGNTPMSGLSSPLIGAGQHSLQANTPSFGPIELVDSTHREMNQYPDRRRQKKAKTTTRKNAKPQGSKKIQSSSTTRQTQPLSSERVIDSDSDSDASVDTSTKASPDSQPTVRRPKQGHHRNVSNMSIPSIVNDEGEEIEPSSPPPAKKPRARIDADISDVEMADAFDEDDENARYFQDDDDDADEVRDGDVDELVLDEGPAKSPTPPPQPTKATSGKPKRRQSSVYRRQSQNHRKEDNPPPLQSHSNVEERERDDDEDNEDFEAALYAELEQAGMIEDDDQESAVGLGIAGAEDDDQESAVEPGIAGAESRKDDESDISEEE